MNFHFLLKNLACGSFMGNVYEMEKVLAKGITHIIALQIGCDLAIWWGSGLNEKYPNIEFLHLYFTDDKVDKPKWIWHTISEYARCVMENEKYKLYVHCALGESRSPAVAYLILRKVLRYSEEKATNILTDYYKKIKVEEKYLPYKSSIETYLKGVNLGLV